MNNDENGIGLPPPTRPAPPMPECNPARREVPQFMQDTLDRVNAKERKNLETRVMWAACLTLERLGYTWEGGAEWKPPLGKAPNFDLLDVARAEIEQLRQQLARQEVRMDASPEFMEQSLARVSAAAGQDPLAADASLETSEDEARPYVAPTFHWGPPEPGGKHFDANDLERMARRRPDDCFLKGSGILKLTGAIRQLEAKVVQLQQEAQTPVVDADYWAGDEEAIRKALVELDDIAQAHDRYELGLPLWLPEQHEKLAEVLRKMLAKQRADLAQEQPADPTTYMVGVKFSASDATKMVEDAIAASGYPWTAAARDVLAERKRQQEVEGWTPERDDRYISCDLARAAATYALCTRPDELRICDFVVWPWKLHWWKPTTYRRNLEKAGALILAEIERLDRAAEKGGAA